MDTTNSEAESNSTNFHTSSSTSISSSSIDTSYFTSNSETETSNDDSTSESYDDTTSFETSSTNDLIQKPRLPMKKKIFIAICIIIFNILLLAVNITVLIIFLKIFSKPEEVEIEKYKYQMIYQNKEDGSTINRIVEFDDVTFEGDFYAFDDEHGNGIIVKIGVEGDEYVMCADQCECKVECQTNDDCESGIECVENLCVDESLKRRKGTSSLLTERKIAQVAVFVPMGLCVLGVFTSLFFAKEYSNNYFSEKCEESCPTNTDSVNVDTDVVVKEEQMKAYTCNGYCMFSEKKWKTNVDNIASEAQELGNEKILETFPKKLAIIASRKPKAFKKYFDQNEVMAKGQCTNGSSQKEIIAPDVKTAVAEFAELLDIQCGVMRFDFTFKGKTFDSPFYSGIGCCEKDVFTIKCV